MTREEARREIDSLDFYLQNHTDDYSEESHAAMMMAIKVLEQEPCEDAISRKKVMNQIFYSTDNSGDVVLGSNLRKRIEELPSVSPARKKGKWIGHGEHCENLGVIPSGLGAYEWCSNCDCGIDVREWHRNHYNYCPNCGAEMEGE